MTSDETMLHGMQKHLAEFPEEVVSVGSREAPELRRANLRIDPVLCLADDRFHRVRVSLDRLKPVLDAQLNCGRSRGADTHTSTLTSCGWRPSAHSAERSRICCGICGLSVSVTLPLLATVIACPIWLTTIRLAERYAARRNATCGRWLVITRGCEMASGARSARWSRTGGGR